MKLSAVLELLCALLAPGCLTEKPVQYAFTRQRNGRIEPGGWMVEIRCEGANKHLSTWGEPGERFASVLGRLLLRIAQEGLLTAQDHRRLASLIQAYDAATVRGELVDDLSDPMGLGPSSHRAEP